MTEAVAIPQAQPDASSSSLKASGSVLRPALDPDTRHATALESIRRFLRDTTCYSILPESYRLIVLDNELTIKRALAALTLNGPYDLGRSAVPCLLSSPMDRRGFRSVIRLFYLYFRWHVDSNRVRASVLPALFQAEGGIVSNSFINIMQYYYTTAITYDRAAADVDGVKLRNLRGTRRSSFASFEANAIVEYRD